MCIYLTQVPSLRLFDLSLNRTAGSFFFPETVSFYRSFIDSRRVEESPLLFVRLSV